MGRYLIFYCVLQSVFYASVRGQCSSNEDCIIVKDCPPILNVLLQNPVPPHEVQRLKNSQCGYEYSTNQPKVCCPRPVTQVGDIQSNLLPNADVCGSDPNKRIFGGQTTGLRQFPWLALLEYQRPNGRGFHCGGSLINENYVLSAAHCILRIPKQWRLISIRLGEYRLDTNPDCDDEDRPGFEDCADPPIDIAVGKVTVHEKYNANNIAQPNDIALIRLSRPVSYTNSIQPICLPTTPEYMLNDFTGVSMTVSGFGRTETRGQSNIKLKVEVPINSESECRELYRNNGATLTENQLCAGGNKGEDSCTGDSGGPLMHLKQSDTEYNWYLYGIVSFGPTGCGTKNFPGIYTKVTKYMPWIISNMQP